MLARLFLVVSIAGLTLSPGPVHADQIDGDWCFKDGSNLTIHGPRIMTPGGNQLQGDYDRHGFAYVVPDGETGAGDRVLMAQQNDNTIHLWRDGGTTTERGTPEVWHRCDPHIS